MFTGWDANSFIHQWDDQKSLHGINKLINGCYINLDLSWLFKLRNCHFLHFLYSKRKVLIQASFLKKNIFFTLEEDCLNFTCISRKTCNRSSKMFGLEKWNCIWLLRSSYSEYKKRIYRYFFFSKKKMFYNLELKIQRLHVHKLFS